MYSDAKIFLVTLDVVGYIGRTLHLTKNKSPQLRHPGIGNWIRGTQKSVWHPVHLLWKKSYGYSCPSPLDRNATTAYQQPREKFTNGAYFFNEGRSDGEGQLVLVHQMGDLCLWQ